MNSRVHQFMSLHGILHRLCCMYTPQQNGHAERRYRHIFEMGLSMMFHAHAPASLWIDAFATVFYVINHLASPILNGKSSFELLFGSVPNYSNFKSFGY